MVRPTTLKNKRVLTLRGIIDLNPVSQAIAGVFFHYFQGVYQNPQNTNHFSLNVPWLEQMQAEYCHSTAC